VPVDAPRLWEALTDPEQASGWLGGHIEWDLYEGSPLLFADEDGSLRRGRVEVVRRGRYLRYRWWDDAGEVSEVSYLLEGDGNATRLTIQERSLKVGRSEAQALGMGGTTPGTVAWSRWDAVLAGLWIALSAASACRVIA
jgi:uncharacterized protein YndB with AHSA1/START domain